jgi:hypothetical protein
MSMRSSGRWAALLVTLAAFVGGALPASAHHVTGGGQSFTFLQPTFTQDLFGVSPHFMGGVAFAPDGDPWVDDCTGGGSELHRFDAQSTPAPVNGTSLHTESPHPSNAGCGLTNHPDGFLYSNIDDGTNGVARLNATTGAPVSVMGPPGNVLGITVDPQTGNVVYVGRDCRFTGTCTIYSLDPTTGTATIFASLAGQNFIDGIAFTPDGNHLFLSLRSPSFNLEILNRSGGIVQLVPMTSSRTTQTGR